MSEREHAVTIGMEPTASTAQRYQARCTCGWKAYSEWGLGTGVLVALSNAHYRAASAPGASGTPAPSGAAGPRLSAGAEAGVSISDEGAGR